MSYCPTSEVTQSPGALIRQGMALIWRGVVAWAVARRQALDETRAKRELRGLDDRHLRDIGLRRDDIDSLFRD